MTIGKYRTSLNYYALSILLSSELGRVGFNKTFETVHEFIILEAEKK